MAAAGLIGIIATVAEDPSVQSSVEKLVSGLFAHLTELVAVGDTEGIAKVVADGVTNKDQIVAAVIQNTGL
jgi:hypothetical protein